MVGLFPISNDLGLEVIIEISSKPIPVIEFSQMVSGKVLAQAEMSSDAIDEVFKED